MKMTVTEAAEQLKCHPETIRRRVRAGAYNSERIGNTILLDITLEEATGPAASAATDPSSSHTCPKCGKQGSAEKPLLLFGSRWWHEACACILLDSTAVVFAALRGE